MPGEQYMATVVPHSPLPAGDLEILGMAADGATNAEIAAAVFLSEDAVKFRFRRILRRMGAKNRTHAVTLAFAPGGWRPSPDVQRAPAGKAPLFLAHRPVRSVEQLIRDASVVTS